MTDRKALKTDDVIEIRKTQIKITGQLGSGSTCLVYIGKIEKSDGLLPGTTVVVKEFYPDDPCADYFKRREDNSLSIPDIVKEHSIYKKRLEQFKTGYENQKKLANSSALEISIKPFMYSQEGEFGDSCYVVTDAHMGQSLDKVTFHTLKEKFECGIRLIDLFEILTDNAGYILLDFKPENLIWIDHPYQLKLLDTDSIISLHSEYDADEDILYTNNRYAAPEMEDFKRILQNTASFAESRKDYIRKEMNVYNVGVFLFELLFERELTEQERQKGFSKDIILEFLQLYKEEKVEKECAEELRDVLQKALSKQTRKRYKTFADFLQDFSSVRDHFTSQKYIPKKAVAKANEMYLAYNMLEKNPLYAYARREGEMTIFDVAIIGQHRFRDSLLKTIIPCAQMLKSRLNIRIFAEDAKKYYETIVSEGFAPELARSAYWYIDGEQIDNAEEFAEAQIVKEPLAYMYLYSTENMDEIANTVTENKISYAVMSKLTDHRDKEDLDKLSKALSAKKSFLAYLADEEDVAVTRNKVHNFRITLEQSSDSYDESSYRSDIYEKALQIHEFYYRGNHPRASKEEVRESFKNDRYNIESSERTALHTDYKLKSLGIDPKSKKAGVAFFEKAEENMRQMIMLEHRSWTAFMIMHGTHTIDSDDPHFEQYAFVGGNDWKERDKNKNVITHPALKYSVEESALTEEIWRTKAKAGKAKWKAVPIDPLDRQSVDVYYAVQKIADQRKEMIGQRIESLKETVLSDIPEAADEFDRLKDSYEKIYNKETNSDRLWEKSAEALQKAITEREIGKNDCDQELKKIRELMKAAIKTLTHFNFKSSDKDVIEAIPKLLLANKKADARLIIIKPLTEDAWKNIFSSIIIQPDRLVLVAPCEAYLTEERKAEYSKYSQWLEKCEIKTEVSIISIGQLRNYGVENNYVFIDETGADPDQVRDIQKNKFMESVHTFKVEERKLKSTDQDQFITTFNRKVNLTVAETIMLHNAIMESEDQPNYLAELTLDECRSIWNLYRRIHDGRKWQVFIGELKRLQQKKIRTKALSPDKEVKKYRSIYVEREILDICRIDEVFAELSKKEILEYYSIPDKGRYDQVYFRTQHEAVADELRSILSKAAEQPAVFKYTVEVTDTDVVFYEDSLYVEGKLSKAKKAFTGIEFQTDTVFREICAVMNRNGSNRILQNLKIDENTGFVSFRYASRGVEEVLRSEGTLLEALIYHECRDLDVFDDIRVNVVIRWKDDFTTNEIDIIGTKDSKTYFISAKMKIPEKLDMYEIRTMCDSFAIEGEAILVTSHFSTGRGEKSSTYFLDHRAEIMKNMNLLCHDDVDGIDKNNHRQIYIGTKIQEIVNR